MIKEIVDGIEFTRINNDVNGNPRYVCHYTAILTEKDNALFPLVCETIAQASQNMSRRYALAVSRANKIGGRKYHTRNYGGGIVFQSYSLQETAEAIRKALAA